MTRVILKWQVLLGVFVASVVYAGSVLAIQDMQTHNPVIWEGQCSFLALQADKIHIYARVQCGERKPSVRDHKMISSMANSPQQPVTCKVTEENTAECELKTPDGK